jgi:hypothetical protein
MHDHRRQKTGTACAQLACENGQQERTNDRRRARAEVNGSEQDRRVKDRERQLGVADCTGSRPSVLKNGLNKASKNDLFLHWCCDHEVQDPLPTLQ